MNLFATIEIYTGGLGSGCKGPNCGRKKLIVGNGWMTKDGRFISAFSSHDDTVLEHSELALGAKLAWGSENSATTQALRNGHIRVWSNEDETAFQAQKKDANTKKQLLKAIDMTPTRKVSIEFLDRSGDIDIVKPEEARRWLETGQKPSDVANWHRE